METHAIAQVPSSPGEGVPSPYAVSVPVEMVFFSGVALVLAAIKWLIAREFNRLEESLKKFDVRLGDLERNNAERQIESAMLNRLDQTVAQLNVDVQTLKQVLTSLPRIEKKIEQIDDLGLGDLKEAIATLVYKKNIDHRYKQRTTRSPK